MNKEHEELNKYLTEIMTGKTYKEHPAFTNFLTWEGFGKLWAWARKQEWWHSQFEPWLLCDWQNRKQYGMVKSVMVDPENFAKAVAHFLKKK